MAPGQEIATRGRLFIKDNHKVGKYNLKSIRKFLQYSIRKFLLHSILKFLLHSILKFPQYSIRKLELPTQLKHHILSNPTLRQRNRQLHPHPMMTLSKNRFAKVIHLEVPPPKNRAHTDKGNMDLVYSRVRIGLFGLVTYTRECKLHARSPGSPFLTR
ncbi:uncharacterized protein LOC117293055 [Asterias rubens]|uniref:uncharacterized protein LOC117293055 n=1 Tax=Asterias rubens TaxID=7604 RepID=UPI0014556F18|nr:uncharacterized protein LOC117293055 [Asterias rubens]